jgi:CubicO group peptidase (beta-lactamase class C family)
MWLVLLTILPALAGPLDGFDAFMAAAMAELKVPGAAAGVIQDGKVILAKGYGVRGALKGKPVTPGTLFAVGSVTKSVTATALATLVQEGKLEWDKPAREYLPWFQLHDPHASELITVRDMLTHRSGLPRYYHPAYGDVRIQAGGARLTAVFNAATVEFRHHHFDTFSTSLGMARFVLDEKGKPSSVYLPVEPAMPPLEFRRQ